MEGVVSDLEQQAQSYLDKSHGEWNNIHQRMVEYAWNAVNLPRYLSTSPSDTSVLELGVGDGSFTRKLLEVADRYVGYDASIEVLDALGESLDQEGYEDSKRISLVRFDLNKGLPNDEKFDVIFAAHILEHIQDDTGLLRVLRDGLKPDGKLVIIVPNAFSVHRFAGVEMGMLKHVHELTEYDKQVGHVRVYDKGDLLSTILDAGYTLVSCGGIFFKPLSFSQMNDWDPKVLDAFAKLGQSYNFQDMAAEIYAVITPDVYQEQHLGI